MKRRIAAPLICLIIILCSITTFVGIAPQSKAATITVDDDGPADYHSIQLAILAASAGDTVYVYSGTYNEHVTVDKTINLTGEDRDTTIIDGQGVGDVVYISADWVNMSGFTIRDSGPNGIPRDAGIDVESAHNVTISYCKFTDNYDAIHLYYSNNSIVSNNVIDDFRGIGVVFSRNVTISGNVISTQYEGIYLDTSLLCRISNNAMTDTGFVLGGSTEHWSTHDIDTSNTVNGDPVYYWKNQNGGTVPFGAGQVILANCSNVNVKNQHISDGYIGIILGFSDENLIRNNNASLNHENGLYLFYSNNNTIEGNTFNDAMNGIDFKISNGNNITENYVSDNGGGMIFVGSDGNNITDNIFWDNLFGLMLVLSDGNNINYNNFTYNWAGSGIYIASSSENIITKNILFENKEGINITESYNNSYNNKVFHNSLIGNTNQAYDDTISENYWDNGYPSGGNYWDDYSGADLRNGPNQDISGADGIGDTPYPIDSDSQDNYPLIAPYGVDSIPPEIELTYPFNNTVAQPGIIINLTISDRNLHEVTYSINSGSYQILVSPFDIETEGWEDNNYRIDVSAVDTSDNTNTASYNIVIDSNPPTIFLESPLNGSYVDASPEIDMTISDANLEEVYYSVNSGTQFLLSSPYIIGGSSWPEGDNILNVQAVDQAGNFNENWFVFNKDSIAPEVALNSPTNGSFLLEPTNIDFEVSDENLVVVSYALNQDAFTAFEEPYDMHTSGWNDGEYSIIIKASDAGGNIIERWFIFAIDTSIPTIESSSITDNEEDVEIDSQITIEFSESMDIETVVSAISIDPYSEYTSIWKNDNKTMTLDFQNRLEFEKLYTISIGSTARDPAGHGLDSTFELTFTTEKESVGNGDKGDGFPFLYLLIFIIAVVVLVIIVSALVISKRKKGSKVPSTTPVELAQSVQISCPQCRFVFSVEKTGGPTNVQCPNCGVGGTMNT
jgi:parallel beta-helix repeat protein